MLKVDKEFKELIPLLDGEEFKQLEANIIKEGCRDSIVIWNNFVIDGHNRFEICQKNNIPFNTIEKRFKDRQEVIEWMILNQFGRRNLTSYVRTQLALRLEPIIQEKAKQNMLATQNNKAGSTILTELQEVQKIDTRHELAKIAKVSEGTIHKVKVIEKEATPEQKEKLEKGEIAINTVYKEIRPPKEKKESVPYQAPKRISTAEVIRINEEIRKPSEEGNLKNTESLKPTSPIIQEMIETLNTFHVNINRFTYMPDLKKLENKSEVKELLNKAFENIKKIKKLMEE